MFAFLAQPGQEAFVGIHLGPCVSVLVSEHCFPVRKRIDLFEASFVLINEARSQKGDTARPRSVSVRKMGWTAAPGRECSGVLCSGTAYSSCRLRSL